MRKLIAVRRRSFCFLILRRAESGADILRLLMRDATVARRRSVRDEGRGDFDV